MCCRQGMWVTVPCSTPPFCSRFTGKIFICDACGGRQYAKKNLLKHIRQHHAHDGLAYIIWKRLWKACGFQQKARKVCCPLCSEQMPVALLVRHLRPKQGHRPRALTYPITPHVPQVEARGDSCFITLGIRTAKIRLYAAFGISRAPTC